jgi:hypothetical protein
MGHKRRATSRFVSANRRSAMRAEGLPAEVTQRTRTLSREAHDQDALDNRVP